MSNIEKLEIVESGRNWSEEENDELGIGAAMSRGQEVIQSVVDVF